MLLFFALWISTTQAALPDLLSSGLHSVFVDTQSEIERLNRIESDKLNMHRFDDSVPFFIPSKCSVSKMRHPKNDTQAAYMFWPIKAGTLKVNQSLEAVEGACF